MVHDPQHARFKKLADKEYQFSGLTVENENALSIYSIIEHQYTLTLMILL